MIAALIALLHTAPRVAAGDSTCTNVPLVADAVDFGGHRYDGPEHVRELLVPRDSIAPNPAHAPRPAHFWLLDTELDGAERYNTIAISVAADPTGAPEEFIPLKKIDWAPGEPARRVRLCWR